MPSPPAAPPADSLSGLSRSRTLAYSLILISLTLGLVFAGFELGLRLLEPPPLTNSGRILRRSENPRKRYELIPGARGVVAGATVSVNSMGCRDREYAVEKPPGVVRIVGIGDSLTFGQGVEQDATWLARMRDALESAHERVQVINCGVYGYNADEDAARFAEVADLLKPDLIIVGYELGDILRNPPPRAEAVDARSETATRSFSPSLIGFVRRSRVVTFLAYRFSFLLKALSLRSWDALYADESPLWENLAKDYTEMGRLARERNIDVLVALIPELSNLNEHYPHRAVHAKVMTLCQHEGMRAADLLPSFLGRDGPRLWIHPQDRHPNSSACAIIAEGLLSPVRDIVSARQRARGQLGP